MRYDPCGQFAMPAVIRKFNIFTLIGKESTMEKYESAKLILELYDLRREATMRKARDWFFRFNPTSVEEIRAVVMSEYSGYYRMVTSYWDMAAALVNHGAIDEQMFNEANGE